MKCSCTAKTVHTYLYCDETIMVLACYYCGKRLDSVSIPRTEEAFKAIKEATQYISNDVEGDTVEQDKLEETEV